MRCRKGHDLELVGYRLRGRGGRTYKHCNACQKVAVQRYRKTDKWRTVRQRWEDGQVPFHTFFDVELWTRFTAKVGRRGAAPTIKRLVAAFVANVESNVRSARKTA